MPLPAILLAVSAASGVVGLAAAGVGGKKIFAAKGDMAEIEERRESYLSHFAELDKATTEEMDKLGSLELEICDSFDEFSDLYEQIKNRPVFDDVTVGSFTIPRYDSQELKEVSIAAGLVLGAIGGAGAGAATGLAAALAAKGAIGAVCVASTGTPIAALNGAAATNAIMAVLGGGTVATGGGGIALGATVLSVAMVGVAILVGGIVFNFAGDSLSEKADEARKQVDEEEEKVEEICKYLGKLKTLATRYTKSLSRVNEVYRAHMERFSIIVNEEQRTDWAEYADEEKLSLENLVLLVGLLYGMCGTNLVVESKDNSDINEVNFSGVGEQMDMADTLLDERELS